MKIVINKCYGGYGLSIPALMRLIELKSETVESFSPKKYYGGENEKYRKKDEWQERWNEDFSSRYKHLNGDWWANDNYTLVYNKKENLLYSDESRHKEEMRTNPILVKVVEELGEKANGWGAELRVIDLPEGIEYEIDDYDGIETVRERHRSW